MDFPSIFIFFYESTKKYHYVLIMETLGRILHAVPMLPLCHKRIMITSGPKYILTIGILLYYISLTNQQSFENVVETEDLFFV